MSQERSRALFVQKPPTKEQEQLLDKVQELVGNGLRFVRNIWSGTCYEVTLLTPGNERVIITSDLPLIAIVDAKGNFLLETNK